MEIINSHAHLIDLKGMLERYPRLSLSSGIASLSHIQDALPLLDPEVLLKQMDDAKINQSVLYAVDAPLVYSSNEYVAGICRTFRDRFTGFASVDPKRKDALDVLKKAVEDMGMRGLKFHPPLQDFYPNDEKFFHLYQAAVDWKIPVVFHVGTTPFGSLSKLSQANPLLIDDVAVTFPELRIVLTHLGTLWHNEAFMVVEKNPCVFIDTAAYLYEIEHLLTADLIARIGENKIIFGTDYPMPSPPLRVHNMIDFVGAIERLATTDQVKEKIFSLNFKKMIDQTPSDLPKGLSLGDIVAQADA